MSYILDELWKQVTGLVVAPIIAAFIVWVVLCSTQAGKSFWVFIQRESGGKALLSVCIISIAMSLAMIAMSIFVTPKIEIISKRIGPGGVEGEVKEPGIFVSSNQGWQKIGDANKSHVCTISNLIVYSPVPGSAANRCELHKDGETWSINVLGSLQCRVTCFDISIRR